jgi:hypothetical protein
VVEGPLREAEGPWFEPNLPRSSATLREKMQKIFSTHFYKRFFSSEIYDDRGRYTNHYRKQAHGESFAGGCTWRRALRHVSSIGHTMTLAMNKQLL